MFLFYFYAQLYAFMFLTFFHFCNFDKNIYLYICDLKKNYGKIFWINAKISLSNTIGNSFSNFLICFSFLKKKRGI